MKKIIIPQKPVATLPRGTAPAARQAKAREALARSGGKQVALNLPAQAVADIEAIKARDGLATTLEAVVAALRVHAST